MEKTKALLLFSGGLDSILAAKLLAEQGVDVTALCFTSNFFNALKAEKAAKDLGLALMVEDISEDELKLIKNPPHGYGKNMNPCLDCHALMVRQAGRIARQGKYDLIATGEVLGQRPFSQNRQALAQVEKLSGIEILRPLSAKNLPETAAEKKGLVKRGRLKAFKGRQREGQLELARRFKVDDFPSPGGGCLLTDPEYSGRLMKMLEYWPDCGVGDVALLSFGRIFWFNGLEKEKIIMAIGRRHEDNENLRKLAKRGDLMVELKEINGPLTLLRRLGAVDFSGPEIELAIPLDLKMSQLGLSEAKDRRQIIEIAALISGWYAPKARAQKVKIIFKYCQ